MSKFEYIVGIDPGSNRHGVAIYNNRKLQSLHNMQAPEIIDTYRYLDCLFVIENVTANKGVYGRNDQQTKKAQGKVGQNVGACKQAQVELMRWLDHYSIPYVLYKPQAGNWAETKNKPIFERITGWGGKSNRDNRSAAFFGYLEINACK